MFVDLDDLELAGKNAMQEPDRAGKRIVTMLASDALEIAAELRAARACADQLRAHVLNDEIYCAPCMEVLVAYEKAAGLPITDPKTTRTYTGQFTAEVER